MASPYRFRTTNAPQCVNERPHLISTSRGAIFFCHFIQLSRCIHSSSNVRDCFHSVTDCIIRLPYVHTRFAHTLTTKHIQARESHNRKHARRPRHHTESNTRSHLIQHPKGRTLSAIPTWLCHTGFAQPMRPRESASGPTRFQFEWGHICYLSSCQVSTTYNLMK